MTIDTDKWTIIKRGIILFDVSSLPADAIITGATLSLYGSGSDTDEQCEQRRDIMEIAKEAREADKKYLGGKALDLVESAIQVAHGQESQADVRKAVTKSAGLITKQLEIETNTPANTDKTKKTREKRTQDLKKNAVAVDLGRKESQDNYMIIDKSKMEENNPDGPSDDEKSLSGASVQSTRSNASSSSSSSSSSTSSSSSSSSSLAEERTKKAFDPFFLEEGGADDNALDELDASHGGRKGKTAPGYDAYPRNHGGRGDRGRPGRGGSGRGGRGGFSGRGRGGDFNKGQNMFQEAAEALRKKQQEEEEQHGGEGSYGGDEAYRYGGGGGGRGRGGRWKNHYSSRGRGYGYQSWGRGRGYGSGRGRGRGRGGPAPKPKNMTWRPGM